jgi:hypothetical protein
LTGCKIDPSSVPCNVLFLITQSPKRRDFCKRNLRYRPGAMSNTKFHLPLFARRADSASPSVALAAVV